MIFYFLAYIFIGLFVSIISDKGGEGAGLPPMDKTEYAIGTFMWPAILIAAGYCIFSRTRQK